MAKIFMTKVFLNGGSQAIRIPAELRFRSPEVFVWLDETTGDVRMSNNRPSRMGDFFKKQQELLPQIEVEDWKDWDQLITEIRKEGNESSRPEVFASDEN